MRVNPIRLRRLRKVRPTINHLQSIATISRRTRLRFTRWPWRHSQRVICRLPKNGKVRYVSSITRINACFCPISAPPVGSRSSAVVRAFRAAASLKIPDTSLRLCRGAPQLPIGPTIFEPILPIWSCPIREYRSYFFCAAVISSSTWAEGLANTSGSRSATSFFHCLTCTGCTSWRYAVTWIDSILLRASSTDCALNSSLNERRF